jgi:hypothetical protein
MTLCKQSQTYISRLYRAFVIAVTILQLTAWRLQMTASFHVTQFDKIVLNPIKLRATEKKHSTCWVTVTHYKFLTAYSANYTSIASVFLILLRAYHLLQPLVILLYLQISSPLDISRSRPFSTKLRFIFLILYQFFVLLYFICFVFYFSVTADLIHPHILFGKFSFLLIINVFLIFFIVTILNLILLFHY